MNDQQRIETAADNCEVLRARLARYEDSQGVPLSSGGGLALALMAALESVVHDERVPNEVSQEVAAVLIEAQCLNSSPVSQVEPSATVKQSLTVEPVAYAAFADNGNIRMWCRSAIGMCELFDAHGNKAVPLYTHPADQVADDLTMVKVPVELLYAITDPSIHGYDAVVTAIERLRALLNGGRA